MIVNVHHFADMVVEYLKKNDNFGMRIEISREEVLLDTGGGLKKAAWFFQEDSGSRDEPFILHNVDVLSTIDLQRMVQFHRRNQGACDAGGAGSRDFATTCCSTSRIDSAGGARDAIRHQKLSERRTRRRRWHFPACM